MPGARGPNDRLCVDRNNLSIGKCQLVCAYRLSVIRDFVEFLYKYRRIIIVWAAVIVVKVNDAPFIGLQIVR